MKVSVIIPARNEEGVLPRLLESLARQTHRDMEVIVVDDSSADRTADLAEAAGAVVLRQETNKGPAAARNAGARIAKGDLLLFLDADTQAPPDLVARIVEAFSMEPPPAALVGRYDPTPLNPGWFPRYKAGLVDWWFGRATECDSFETNLGAIPRETFMRLGGFDERYQGADVEDYEFGDRVWAIGPIKMDPALTVRHQFPGFWRNAANFFSRSRMWARLRIGRRRGFDRSAATASQAAASMASLMALAWPAALILLPLSVWLPIAALILLVFIAGNAGLLVHLSRAEGVWFAIVAAPVTAVQQAAAAAGAVAGSLQGLVAPFDSRAN